MDSFKFSSLFDTSANSTVFDLISEKVGSFLIISMKIYLFTDEFDENFRF
jgi:hypothetical protein